MGASPKYSEPASEIYALHKASLYAAASRMLFWWSPLNVSVESKLFILISELNCGGLLWKS